MSDFRRQQRRWRSAIAARCALGFLRWLTRDLHIEHSIGASRTDHQADRFSGHNANMRLGTIGEIAKARCCKEQHSEKDPETHRGRFRRDNVSRRCGGLSALDCYQSFFGRWTRFLGRKDLPRVHCNGGIAQHVPSDQKRIVETRPVGEINLAFDTAPGDAQLHHDDRAYNRTAAASPD